MEQIHNKLVRDKIIEKIEKNKETAVYRVLSSEEKIEFLKLKLTEEIDELKEAINLGNKEKIIEESCDVLEVIDAINKCYNTSFEEVLANKKEKCEHRGSFDKGIFLEKTL